MWYLLTCLMVFWGCCESTKKNLLGCCDSTSTMISVGCCDSTSNILVVRCCDSTSTILFVGCCDSTIVDIPHVSWCCAKAVGIPFLFSSALPRHALCKDYGPPHSMSVFPELLCNLAWWGNLRWQGVKVNIGVCACDASLRNIYRVTGWSISICQPRNIVKMAIIIKSSSFQHFSIVFWGTASPLHTVLLKTDQFSSKHVQTHTDT